MVAKVPARAMIQLVWGLVLLTPALLPIIPTVGRLLLAGVAIVPLAFGWKRVMMAPKYQPRVSRSGIQLQDPEKRFYMPVGEARSRQGHEELLGSRLRTIAITSSGKMCTRGVA